MCVLLCPLTVSPSTVIKGNRLSCDEPVSPGLRRSAALAQTPFPRVIICFTSLRPPLLISSFLRDCFSSPSSISLAHPALFSSYVATPSSSLVIQGELLSHCLLSLCQPRPLSVRASCSIPLFVVIPFIFFSSYCTLRCCF